MKKTIIIVTLIFASIFSFIPINVSANIFGTFNAEESYSDWLSRTTPTVNAINNRAEKYVKSLNEFDSTTICIYSPNFHSTKSKLKNFKKDSAIERGYHHANMEVNEYKKIMEKYYIEQYNYLQTTGKREVDACNLLKQNESKYHKLFSKKYGKLLQRLSNEKVKYIYDRLVKMESIEFKKADLYTKKRLLRIGVIHGLIATIEDEAFRVYNLK